MKLIYICIIYRMINIIYHPCSFIYNSNLIVETRILTNFYLTPKCVVLDDELQCQSKFIYIVYNLPKHLCLLLYIPCCIRNRDCWTNNHHNKHFYNISSTWTEIYWLKIDLIGPFNILYLLCIRFLLCIWNVWRILRHCCALLWFYSDFRRRGFALVLMVFLASSQGNIPATTPKLLEFYGLNTPGQLCLAFVPSCRFNIYMRTFLPVIHNNYYI